MGLDPKLIGDLLFGSDEPIDAFALGAKHAREIRAMLAQQSDESSLKRASLAWYHGLCHYGGSDPVPEKEEELLRALEQAFRQRSG